MAFRIEANHAKQGLLFIGGSLSDFFSSSLKKADGVHL
jgi:hypothetical protein